MEAGALVAQIDDYILPRLANIDAPLLAVVEWLDGQWQVDAGQRDRGPAGDHLGCDPADHPAAGAGGQPGGLGVGSTHPGAARPGAGAG
ncbi:hypothetical protein QP028_04985 [Corynebacterium suedekumii]|nr:hypothetical protein QP028_04985 [Corynebacterium suedekumii]